MKEDRTTISVRKKMHADFERYRAILSAERGKVQTQEVIKDFKRKTACRALERGVPTKRGGRW